MLLNYLLCFSLLIVSVIKTADIYKKSNTDLNKTKKDFIKITREKHNQGSLSLNGALFATMFSLLLLFFALKFKVELKEARYRRDSYLCMHYLDIKTANYIYDMTALNWLLRSAFAATLSVVATPEAMETLKALQLARDARHAFFLKELFTYRYCTKEMVLPSLTQLPYKTKKIIKLDAHFDSTTQLRKSTWTRNLYKLPSGIRLKNSFCLQSHYRMEGVMIPNLKIQTQEISNGVISKLKCLSGFQ